MGIRSSKTQYYNISNQQRHILYTKMAAEAVDYTDLAVFKTPELLFCFRNYCGCEQVPSGERRGSGSFSGREHESTTAAGTCTVCFATLCS